MTDIITRYTLYGERRSGTNFVRQLMFDNFGTVACALPESVSGWKHFFGSNDNRAALQQTRDCLIFCLVRNPLDWLMSFWYSQCYQPEERLTDLTSFLTSEFYSVWPDGLEIMEDRRRDGSRYADIFDLRSEKCRFLLQVIPVLNPHGIFVRYEDLKADPAKILQELESRFGLQRRFEHFRIEPKRILPQVNETTFELSDAPLLENYQVPDDAKEIILERLDFETEALIGYPRDPIVERLRGVVYPE